MKKRQKRRKPRSRARPRTKKRTKKQTDGTKIKQDSFKMNCPKHKTEPIYRMYFNMTLKVTPKNKNGREWQGKHMATNWFFCNKCKKAYQVKYTVIR